jgi:hypothetical protein
MNKPLIICGICLLLFISAVAGLITLVHHINDNVQRQADNNPYILCIVELPDHKTIMEVRDVTNHYVANSLVRYTLVGEELETIHTHHFISVPSNMMFTVIKKEQ